MKLHKEYLFFKRIKTIHFYLKKNEEKWNVQKIIKLSKKFIANKFEISKLVTEISWKRKEKKRRSRQKEWRERRNLKKEINKIINVKQNEMKLKEIYLVNWKKTYPCARKTKWKISIKFKTSK